MDSELSLQRRLDALAALATTSGADDRRQLLKALTGLRGRLVGLQDSIEALSRGVETATGQAVSDIEQRLGGVATEQAERVAATGESVRTRFTQEMAVLHDDISKALDQVYDQVTAAAEELSAHTARATKESSQAMVGATEAARKELAEGVASVRGELSVGIEATRAALERLGADVPRRLQEATEAAVTRLDEVVRQSQFSIAEASSQSQQQLHRAVEQASEELAGLPAQVAARIGELTEAVREGVQAYEQASRTIGPLRESVARIADEAVAARADWRVRSDELLEELRGASQVALDELRLQTARELMGLRRSISESVAAATHEALAAQASSIDLREAAAPFPEEPRPRLASPAGPVRGRSAEREDPRAAG